MAHSFTLFDGEDSKHLPPSSDELAAKTVIDKLLKVRRSMTLVEQRFALPKVNLLIEELRSLTRATPSQREEMILYSVERQGAITETEIAGDTHLHRTIVDKLVEELIGKGLLYRVSRTVPGSGRPQFAIKSMRVKTPEAEG